MSTSANKKKRAAPAQTPIPSTQSNVIASLLDSYDFLAANEYSEKTIGLQAFLLRKAVGDINFSDIIDESEKRSRTGQTANCVTILEDKRTYLPEIDASVEKCMMLTRLISYIKEREVHFTSLLSDIRMEIQYNMTDEQRTQTTIDFRQRENDFMVRKHAQEIRRLFYHSDKELGKPKNLVRLQNRTTEQLNYLVQQMSRDSKNRHVYNKELETLLKTSFLISTQPHSGVNPVTIYERRGPGEYIAKISVTIISLLYDFIQQHPNLIELCDIEPSLQPPSTYYTLAEPRTISWKTCHIQPALGGRPRTFLCAELSTITIEQSSKTDTRVRFAQLLHSLKFAIKLQFNLADSSKNPVYQLALDSLQFGIGAHNNQIPQMLTRVLLHDIRHFSRSEHPEVKKIHDFIIRYFIHRTGVSPNYCVRSYLEQELIRATRERSSFETLEDIYLDFLVNFVYQVEFMAKHPILSMFHADGLFLGICSSERAAEAVVQSSVTGSPVIALRFNSIRIDYNAIATQHSANRTVKLAPCAVRVDIYNDRTKKLQNRTFDSSVLATDISKFVASAFSDSAARIHILASIDNRVDDTPSLQFTSFGNYYHQRLQEISKSDEKYKPVTDLVDNANDGNTDEDIIENLNAGTKNLTTWSPHSLPASSPGHMDLESSDGNGMSEYTNASYENSNSNHSFLQSTLSSPSAPSATASVNNQEALLDHFVQNNPQLVEELLRQYQAGLLTTPVPIATQAQVQYTMPPSPHYSQMPMPMPQQQQQQQQQQQSTVPPMQFVQQPIYPPSQNFPQTQMQLPQQPPPQMFFPQQVMFQPQQQQVAPSMRQYLPRNPSQPPFPSQAQFQSFPTYQNPPVENQAVQQSSNTDDLLRNPLFDEAPLDDFNVTDFLEQLSPTTTASATTN